jgi:hypothetical protein
LRKFAERVETDATLTESATEIRRQLLARIARLIPQFAGAWRVRRRSSPVSTNACHSLGHPASAVPGCAFPRWLRGLSVHGKCRLHESAK